MGWRYHKERIECIRKVIWDDLWHVVYKVPIIENQLRETWDRVDKRTAMYVAKNMDKWRWGKKEQE